MQFVYEVSDTEGKELPSQVLNPFSGTGSVSDAIYYKFIENLPIESIKYIETIDGSQRAGSDCIAFSRFLSFDIFWYGY